MILRFDHALSDEVCGLLAEPLRAMIRGRQTVNVASMPWFDHDTINWVEHSPDTMFWAIDRYRQFVCDVVGLMFGEPVWVNFTDLVLWRKGRSMERHRDDGYTADDQFRARHFTTITYLNDDYAGGETFIRVPGQSADYVSKPKRGTLVIFPTGEEFAHGVNPVTAGNRYTFPIWLTRTWSARETQHELRKRKLICGN